MIDGRARKECVHHVLRSALLKNGGLVALFEAGRGIDGWMNSPALTGSYDYQPEVREMIAAGGEIVDGDGLDRWPTLNTRRTFSPAAFHYPTEACFLVIKPMPYHNATN